MSPHCDYLKLFCSLISWGQENVMDSVAGITLNLCISVLFIWSSFRHRAIQRVLWLCRELQMESQPQR